MNDAQSDSRDDIPKPSIPQRLGAEALGTFALTFVAGGADLMYASPATTAGNIARYVAPGLLVAAIIWSLSAISGAHVNPAVTFGFWLRRTFPAGRVPGYVIAQLVGALAAAWLLKATFGSVAPAVSHAGSGFTDLQALIVEMVMTALLVFTILATAKAEAVVGKNAALAVGGVIALAGLVFGPVSGASLNPARSFGPAALATNYTSLSIYIVGPLAGAVAANILAWLIYGGPSSAERAAAHGKHG